MHTAVCSSTKGRVCSQSKLTLRAVRGQSGHNSMLSTACSSSPGVATVSHCLGVDHVAALVIDMCALSIVCLLCAAELRRCTALRELHLEHNRLVTPLLDLTHATALESLQVREGGAAGCMRGWVACVAC